VKRLLAAAYVAFALLLGGSIYIASTRYDGLVDPAYSEKAARFFRDAEAMRDQGAPGAGAVSAGAAGPAAARGDLQQGPVTGRVGLFEVTL